MTYISALKPGTQSYTMKLTIERCVRHRFTMPSTTKIECEIENEREKKHAHTHADDDDGYDGDKDGEEESEIIFIERGSVYDDAILPFILLFAMLQQRGLHGESYMNGMSTVQGRAHNAKQIELLDDGDIIIFVVIIIILLRHKNPNAEPSAPTKLNKNEL